MLTKKRFLPVLVPALLMLLLVVFLAWQQGGALVEQVRFVDVPRNQALKLHYDSQEDQYVLFLPGYVSAGDVEADCPNGISLRYDGKESLADASLSEEILMTVSSFLHTQKVKLRLETVGDLPTIFVEAEEGLLDYLNADKKNTRDVAVRMVDGDGRELLQSTASMYGRGNGSWESPSKKPYNLEFPRGISVGPFENVTKLAMLAEFSDESKLRNSLAYHAGEALGVDYASAYQYTNLYVSGQYQGIYGLVTKQVYQQHLVSDGIQAVFEMATGANRVEFRSELGWRINVMQGSKERVQAVVSQLEGALTQGDWAQIAALIDVESFAQKYALEEFLANLDMSYASQYFYLGADGKLRCMLPWDYDWTLGSSYHYFNNRQAKELKVLRNENAWYGLLLKHEPFRQAVVTVLQEQFDDALLQDLEQHLLSSIEAIGPAWQADKLRWKNELPYHQYEVASGVEDLEGFYALFREFFYDRRDFLLDYFAHPENYCYVWFYDARWGNLFVPLGTDLAQYLEGATILDVKVPGERFLGWYVGDTPLEEIGPIWEEVAVRGYYEELPSEVSYLSRLRLEIGLAAVFALVALTVLWKSWPTQKRRVHEKKIPS